MVRNRLGSPRFPVEFRLIRLTTPPFALLPWDGPSNRKSQPHTISSFNLLLPHKFQIAPARYVLRHVEV